MKHIGIDLGSRKSHICIRDESSTILQELALPTEGLGAWFCEQEPATVVLETCTESFTIADLAMEAGHTVRVVPAAIVRQLGVGHRGVKNDVRDAQVLSRASIALGAELPTVHVPSREARVLRQLLSERATLVGARTSLINALKGQLRGKLLRLPSSAARYVSRRARERLTDSHPELLAMLEPLLTSIDALTDSIAALGKQIADASEADDRIALLLSVPGVGSITAASFVATIDDPQRFACAMHVGSYLGLTPRENSTGGQRHFGGITRAGQATLRTLLIQASWTLVRVAPRTPLAKHFVRLIERRPKQVAIAAIARRLAGVLFAMMRDGTFFDPKQTTPKSRTTTPSQDTAPASSITTAATDAATPLNAEAAA